MLTPQFRSQAERDRTLELDRLIAGIELATVGRRFQLSGGDNR
jgi:hypothetical protein